MTDPAQKAQATKTLWQVAAEIPLDCNAIFPSFTLVGKPDRPELVHPQNVPRRSPFTAEGHAALIHSIAHIEFNAINLALDAIWRFAGMPEPYYRDWLQVAQEEAKHYMLLQNHLQTLGYDYGDFSAHEGLWTVSESTRHDVIARMALVPRTMEARGLDATPQVQAKLRKVGTPQALAAVDILEIILQEEVGHVAIGNHWYHWLCQREGLDPASFYAHAAVQHGAPRLKPPFNIAARRLAGFSEAEIQSLPPV
jgi:uncharacterized ferritin-like protein (DUF455 family)